MYTWGYIKNACLAKLDMTADEAVNLGFMNKFPFYANEAITQICSAVKPKHTFAEFTVVYKDVMFKLLQKAYPDIKDWSFLDKSKLYYEDFSEDEQKAWSDWHQCTFVGENARMPADYISMGGEVDRRLEDEGKHYVWEEADDTDFVTHGYGGLIFMHPGVYQVAYNARWLMINSDTDDDCVLDAPTDVLECLPSYIVSQCYKVDDETKAQIYRNEYEMFLARIDDDMYTTNRTMKIRGGW